MPSPQVSFSSLGWLVRQPFGVANNLTPVACYRFIRPSIAFGGWGSDKEYNERGDQPREAIGHSPSQQSPTPKATLPLQAAAKKHRQQKGLLPNKESSSSPVNKPTSLATPLRAPRHVNPYADPSDPFSTKSLAAAWGVDP